MEAGAVGRIRWCAVVVAEEGVEVRDAERDDLLGPGARLGEGEVAGDPLACDDQADTGADDLDALDDVAAAEGLVVQGDDRQRRGRRRGGGVGIDLEQHRGVEGGARHGDDHAARDTAGHLAVLQQEDALAVAELDRASAEAEAQVVDREHRHWQGRTRRVGRVGLGRLLEGDVRGQRLARDGEDHVRRGDAQVRAGRKVELELVAADGHRLADSVHRLVDGELEVAGDLHGGGQQAGQVDRAGEAGCQARGQHDEHALDVGEDRVAVDHELAGGQRQDRARGAGAAGGLLDREAAAEAQGASEDEGQVTLEPEVGPAGDRDAADIRCLGAGVDHDIEGGGVDAVGRLDLHRAEGEVERDGEGAGDSGGRGHQRAVELKVADAGQLQGGVGDAEAYDAGLGDRVRDLLEDELVDGEHLTGDRQHDVVGVRRAGIDAEAAAPDDLHGAGRGVDHDLEASGEADPGHVEREVAGDRAGDAEVGEDQVGAALREGDDRGRSAEAEADVAQHDTRVGVRRRRVDVRIRALLEDHVAGEPLAGDVHDDADALESNEGAGRDDQGDDLGAQVHLGRHGGGAGVDGQLDITGDGGPGDEHRDGAAEARRHAGRRDHEGSRAVLELHTGRGGAEHESHVAGGDPDLLGGQRAGGGVGRGRDGDLLEGEDAGERLTGHGEVDRRRLGAEHDADRAGGDAERGPAGGVELQRADDRRARHAVDVQLDADGDVGDDAAAGDRQRAVGDGHLDRVLQRAAVVELLAEAQRHGLCRGAAGQVCRRDHGAQGEGHLARRRVVHDPEAAAQGQARDAEVEESGRSDRAALGALDPEVAAQSQARDADDADSTREVDRARALGASERHCHALHQEALGTRVDRAVVEERGTLADEHGAVGHLREAGLDVEGSADLDEVADLDRRRAGDRDEGPADGGDLARPEDDGDLDAPDDHDLVDLLSAAVEPHGGAGAERAAAQVDRAGERASHSGGQQQEGAVDAGDVDAVEAGDRCVAQAEHGHALGDLLDGAGGRAVHQDVDVAVGVDVADRSPDAGHGDRAAGREAVGQAAVAVVVAVEDRRVAAREDQHIGVAVAVDVTQCHPGAEDTGSACRDRGGCDDALPAGVRGGDALGALVADHLRGSAIGHDDDVGEAVAIQIPGGDRRHGVGRAGERVGLRGPARGGRVELVDQVVHAVGRRDDDVEERVVVEIHQQDVDRTRAARQVLRGSEGELAARDLSVVVEHERVGAGDELSRSRAADHEIAVAVAVDVADRDRGGIDGVDQDRRREAEPGGAAVGAEVLAHVDDAVCSHDDRIEPAVRVDVGQRDVDHPARDVAGDEARDREGHGVVRRGGRRSGRAELDAVRRGGLVGADQHVGEAVPVDVADRHGGLGRREADRRDGREARAGAALDEEAAGEADAADRQRGAADLEAQERSGVHREGLLDPAEGVGLDDLDAGGVDLEPHRAVEDDPRREREDADVRAVVVIGEVAREARRDAGVRDQDGAAPAVVGGHVHHAADRQREIRDADEHDLPVVRGAGEAVGPRGADHADQEAAADRLAGDDEREPVGLDLQQVGGERARRDRLLLAGRVELELHLGAEGDTGHVDRHGAGDHAVHAAGAGRADKVQLAVDVRDPHQRRVGAAAEHQLGAAELDRHQAGALGEVEGLRREALACQAQHDVGAGDREGGLARRGDGDELGGEGALQLDTGHVDQRDRPGHRAVDAGGAQGQVGGAVAQADEGPRAVPELQQHVGSREVDGRAGTLHGDVAGELLTGDLDDDAGAGDPQVGTRRNVDGDLATAHDDGSLDPLGRGVDGQAEHAGDRHARDAHVEIGRQLRGRAAGGEHQQAGAVRDGGDAVGEVDPDVGQADGDDLAGRRRDLLDGDVPGEDLTHDRDLDAGARHPHVAPLGVEIQRKLAAEADARHGEIDIAGDGGRHAGRAERQRGGRARGLREGGRRSPAAQHEREVLGGHVERRPAGRGAAHDRQVAGEGLAEHGEGQILADDADVRALLELERRRDAGDGEGLGDGRGGDGVELDRQIPADLDLRDVEGDDAADRAGETVGTHQQERGAIGEGQHAAAEGESHVAGGDLEERAAGAGHLLERDVAAQGLTRDGEQEALRVEAQVRAARQCDHDGLARHLEALVHRAGAGVEGEADLAAGADARRQVQRDEAREAAGHAAGGDHQESRAVDQSHSRSRGPEREAHPREADGGDGLACQRRTPLDHDVARQGLAEHVDRDGRALEAQVGAGGQVDADRGPVERDRLGHRDAGRVDRHGETGAERDARHGQRQRPLDAAGHPGRRHQQQAGSVGQRGRAEVERDVREGQGQVAGGVLAHRQVGGERLAHQTHGDVGEGERRGLARGDVDHDGSIGAAGDLDGLVDVGPGAVVADGDGADQGHAVDAEDGHGAGGDHGVRVGRCPLLDADGRLGHQHADSQRADRAVRHEGRALPDEDAQALAREDAAREGDAALDGDEVADLQREVGDREVEDGLAGARLLESDRQLAAAHRDRLAHGLAGAVDAHVHGGAGVEAALGDLQVAAEEACDAGADDDHGALAAADDVLGAVVDGDLGEGQHGGGGGAYDREAAGEGEAADPQHHGVEGDGDQIPVEHQGGGAGREAETRIEGDPEQGEASAGALRRRGERAADSVDGEDSRDVEEIDRVALRVRERDLQGAGTRGVDGAHHRDVGVHLEAAGVERRSGDRDREGARCQADRRGAGEHEARHVERYIAADGDRGDAARGSGDRAGGVADREQAATHGQRAVGERDDGRAVDRVLREAHVAAELLTEHVEEETGADDLERACRAVEGDLQRAGDGDTGDVEDDRAADASGVVRAGHREGAVTVGERQAREREADIGEGHVEDDRPVDRHLAREREVGGERLAADRECDVVGHDADRTGRGVDLDVEDRARCEAGKCEVERRCEAARDAVRPDDEGAAAVRQLQQRAQGITDRERRAFELHLVAGRSPDDAAAEGQRRDREVDALDRQRHVRRREGHRRDRGGGVDGEEEGRRRRHARDGEGHRAADVGGREACRADLEGAGAVRELEEGRAAGCESGREVVDRQDEPGGSVRHRHVGREALAGDLDGESGADQLGDRCAVGEGHEHIARSHRDRDVDRGSGAVVTHPDRAADGEVADSDHGHLAGDVRGVQAAALDDRDDRVAHQETACGGVALAVGEVERPVPEEHRQPGAAEDHVAAAFGEADRPLDVDRAQVERAAHRDREHVLVAGAEDDARGRAVRGDRLVDRGAGGVETDGGRGLGSGADHDGAAEVSRDASAGDDQDALAVGEAGRRGSDRGGETRDGCDGDVAAVADHERAAGQFAEARQHDRGADRRREGEGRARAGRVDREADRDRAEVQVAAEVERRGRAHGPRHAGRPDDQVELAGGDLRDAEVDRDVICSDGRGARAAVVADREHARQRTLGVAADRDGGRGGVGADDDAGRVDADVAGDADGADLEGDRAGDAVGVGGVRRLDVAGHVLDDEHAADGERDIGEGQLHLAGSDGDRDVAAGADRTDLDHQARACDREAGSVVREADRAAQEHAARAIDQGHGAGRLERHGGAGDLGGEGSVAQLEPGPRSRAADDRAADAAREAAAAHGDGVSVDDDGQIPGELEVRRADGEPGSRETQRVGGDGDAGERQRLRGGVVLRDEGAVESQAADAGQGCGADRAEGDIAACQHAHLELGEVELHARTRDRVSGEERQLAGAGDRDRQDVAGRADREVAGERAHGCHELGAADGDAEDAGVQRHGGLAAERDAGEGVLQRQRDGDAACRGRHGSVGADREGAARGHAVGRTAEGDVDGRGVHRRRLDDVDGGVEAQPAQQHGGGVAGEGVRAGDGVEGQRELARELEPRDACDGEAADQRAGERRARGVGGDRAGAREADDHVAGGEPCARVRDGQRGADDRDRAAEAAEAAQVDGPGAGQVGHGAAGGIDRDGAARPGEAHWPRCERGLADAHDELVGAHCDAEGGAELTDVAEVEGCLAAEDGGAVGQLHQQLSDACRHQHRSAVEVGELVVGEAPAVGGDQEVRGDRRVAGPDLHAAGQQDGQLRGRACVGPHGADHDPDRAGQHGVRPGGVPHRQPHVRGAEGELSRGGGVHDHERGQRAVVRRVAGDERAEVTEVEVEPGDAELQRALARRLTLQGVRGAHRPEGRRRAEGCARGRDGDDAGEQAALLDGHVAEIDRHAGQLEDVLDGQVARGQRASRDRAAVAELADDVVDEARGARDGAEVLAEVVELGGDHAAGAGRGDQLRSGGRVQVVDRGIRCGVADGDAQRDRHVEGVDRGAGEGVVREEVDDR